MLGSEQFSMSVRVATVVVPVAVYFLLIGLLNSRRHPQVLTGRGDFILLMAAICPPFLLSLGSLAGSVTAIIAITAGGAIAILLLAPRTGTWVIYNTTRREGCQAVCRALHCVGVEAKIAQCGVEVIFGDVSVRIGGFAPLRNVSIHLHGADKDFSRRFGAALSNILCQTPAVTSPMAASFLMIATAMLIAPMAMMAQQVPEIVRILSDLLG